MGESIISSRLPILALRGLVVFPKQTIHFDVGRKKSALALEKAMLGDKLIFLVPQTDAAEDDPDIDGLHHIGTIAKVKQVLRGQGDVIRILVTGIRRGSIEHIYQTGPYLEGEVRVLTDTPAADSPRNHALCREANSLYSAYLEASEYPSQATHLQMIASRDAGYIADSIAQNSGMDFPDKMAVLSDLNPTRRLENTIRLLHREIQLIQLEGEIQSRTHANMDRNQREYYLREQLKVIREELGDVDEEAEFSEYERKILLLNLDETSEAKLRKDVERLRKQPFGSAEAAVLRNYLDAVLELPWHKRTKERVNVEAAHRLLDKDHYGMEKVKERILETIAVRQLAPQMPPQILCLVGPPGVGKTSIAYSIADSLNRKIARISLGGVRDEADIRGHRKTYVGAMPGRIMTAMTQAGTQNPILLLDEIDKMGSDYRGDPSAALLEVLDAEQNKTYRDHYLEVPFDLSDVMFITTANTLDTVPRPLLDRMEIIELGSYTDEEKVMIAQRHLLPKQMRKHGLLKTQLRVTEGAIREMVQCYTRESGVRNLERCFAEVCRKVAKKRAETELEKRITVTGANIEEFLGVRKYLPDRIPGNDLIGVVTGLAWTAVGGDTLDVEVNVMDGSGKLEITGNLGDVMKESVHAAVSYIRANAAVLGVPADFYKNRDIHVHFPAGATPKDGPSAGIAVCTAIVSALTNVPVRCDVAMTGEISIRGRVLPIGGLKEKTMAALRAGVSTVIIPEDNRRDLEEIDPLVRKSLNFVTAKSIDSVLAVALKKNGEVLPVLLNELSGEVRNRGKNKEIRQ